jgi:HDOD domain
LARDPNIEMMKAAQVVGRDAAMTVKVLRIANSAFYVQRQPSQNLRQLLGQPGIDYPDFGVEPCWGRTRRAPFASRRN